MEYDTLLYEKSKGIATITLNRPEVLNALNQRLWLELQNSLEDAQKDQTIKVVIITGQGRAFSSGADLKESKTRTADQYRDYLESLHAIDLVVGKA